MSRKSDPKFTRAMLVLYPLAKAFITRGGDIDALLARNGIPHAALTDPKMLVSAVACYAAMEDIADTLGDPYFGAKVAIETAEKGTPAFREAAAHALTLGGFLSRLVVEVPKQVDNVRYSVSVTPDAASFEVRRTVTAPKPSSQLDAVGVTLFVTLIKKGIGETFDPKDVLITVPTTNGLPPGFLPKRSLITSPIEGLRISFPSHWLWAPFSLDWAPSAMPRGEFSADDESGATLTYINGMLRDNVAYPDLHLKSFAAVCGLHPRRVQRILQEMGTSFSRMRDNMRQCVAEELLTQTALPVSQIALEVGVSSPAALDRAFRRWTGKTPTQFRAEAKTEQVCPAPPAKTLTVM